MTKKLHEKASAGKSNNFLTVCVRINSHHEHENNRFSLLTRKALSFQTSVISTNSKQHLKEIYITINILKREIRQER